MGLGLLFLASVGKENLYLSGSAEITYFKFIYKQYTNFSIEPMSQYFKTEPDFSRKITVNISKNADLLSNMYLHIKLPSIPFSNHSYLPSNIKKFKWIDKIGFGMIKYIDLEIGGTLIDRINGEYLNILYELGNKKMIGYRKMIGNVSELTDYTNGKDSYSLDIPIHFWFHKNYYLSLPLVALYHTDIKIHVEFNSINKCYLESPTHYITVSNSFCLFKDKEIIKQEIDGNTAVARFCYFDVVEKRLYYDKIYNDFVIPSSSQNLSLYNIKGIDSEFEVSLNSSSELVHDESYFSNTLPSIELSYLIVDYIYLDNNERFLFMNNEIEYVVPVLDIIPEKKIFSINSEYKLDSLNSPVKILFWRTQLLSNYNSNDLFNYSSYPVDLNSSDLINKVNIVINSSNREEIDFVKFYNILQVYFNEFFSINDGIYMYSFGLDPKVDSSGYCNFNKISDAYLQISFNKLVSYKNPILLKGYAISLNLFRVSNGLGDLVFYN